MADEYNITEVSDSLLTAARNAIRVKKAIMFDGEIKDLIRAARKELTEIGILPAKACDETDPLIRRACIIYVKAEFGLDNPDAERYRASFDTLKKHLSYSSEYIGR